MSGQRRAEEIGSRDAAHAGLQTVRFRWFKGKSKKQQREWFELKDTVIICYNYHSNYNLFLNVTVYRNVVYEMS